MSNSSHHSDKPHILRKYIMTPLVYVLISLIIIVPASIVLLNLSVKAVHKAQKAFPMSVGDVVLSDSGFTPSDKQFGTVEIPQLQYGEKVGEIECADAGMRADVYYGNDRVSRREGAGLAVNSGLCGCGETVFVSGNATTAFKALENVEEGDIIAFTTSWGVYEYTVESVEKRSDVPKYEKGEALILETESSKNAYSYFSGEKLYCIARYTSGPAAEEVQE